jgi:ubiquinone/menaquinone biosynthesis C-methylase UbiE
MHLLDRNITLFANFVLDNILPPILRDCKYIMYPIMRLAYGRETKLLLKFKEKFPFMNNAEGSVLDAACGRGYLLTKILESNPDVQCYGIDIVPTQKTHSIYDDWAVVNRGGMQYKFQTADIINLPFQDHSFDIVLCTHALEHIRDPHKALKELIRVCRQRLIIVVPKQREYRYTVDFHVNFFPYLYSFKRFIGIENAVYLNLKGDLLCCIDF